MSSPDEMKARELIESWVLGKIPAYEDKIKQVAKLIHSVRQAERDREITAMWQLALTEGSTILDWKRGIERAIREQEDL